MANVGNLRHQDGDYKSFQSAQKDLTTNSENGCRISVGAYIRLRIMARFIGSFFIR